MDKIRRATQRREMKGRTLTMGFHRGRLQVIPPTYTLPRMTYKKLTPTFTGVPPHGLLMSEIEILMQKTYDLQKGIKKRHAKNVRRKGCGWDTCKCGSIFFSVPRICYPHFFRMLSAMSLKSVDAQKLHSSCRFATS